MATVGFQASDLFAAGANFNEQSSSSITNETNPFIQDADGNMQCVTAGLNTTTEYTCEYAYCNGTPDIATDAATLLTKFGDVHDSKKMTQLSLSFSAGEYATMSGTGHNHAEEAHTAGLADGYADVSAVIPAGAGFGVPTLTGQTWGTNATGVSLTITFSATHTDRVDFDGNHFVGKNTLIRAELSMEFLGVPTTHTATGWNTLTEGPADTNQDYDSYTYTAERWFDLATA